MPAPAPIAPPAPRERPARDGADPGLRMRFITSRLGLPQVKWTLMLVGLSIYTFVIVTYYFRIAEVGIAIALLGLLLQAGRWRVPAPVALYLAFVLWAFVASFMSTWADVAVDRVIEYLKLAVIMLIVVNALRTEGQLRFYLLLLLGCFMLFPVRGTLVGGDDIAGRAVWNYIYANPNDLATLCLIALGIAVGFAFSGGSRPIVRLGGVVCILFLLVVILKTQSRGAFIGLIAGLGPAVAAMAVKRPVLLVLGGAVVAAVLSLAVPETVWNRLAGIEKLADTSTIAQADAEGSAEQRLAIQRTALRIAVDHPLFGVGLGAYPLANARYEPGLGRKDTHNTYLNLLAEVGFPGFILWCAMVWSVVRHAYRARQRAGPSDLATQQAWIERAMWGYFVAGLFGSYAKLSFPYLMLGVLWCSATLLAAMPAAAGGREEPGK